MCFGGAISSNCTPIACDTERFLMSWSAIMGRNAAAAAARPHRLGSDRPLFEKIGQYRAQGRTVDGEVVQLVA
jgi:hypothetical protein